MPEGDGAMRVGGAEERPWRYGIALPGKRTRQPGVRPNCRAGNDIRVEFRRRPADGSHSFRSRVTVP